MPRLPRVLSLTLCAALTACDTTDVVRPVDASASRGDTWAAEGDSPQHWLDVANEHLDPARPAADQDPAVAVDAARRALRAMAQPTADAWATLGTACYLAGDLSGALDAYERALSLADADSAPWLRAWTTELRTELAAPR